MPRKHTTTPLINAQEVIEGDKGSYHRITWWAQMLAVGDTPLILDLGHGIGRPARDGTLELLLKAVASFLGRPPFWMVAVRWQDSRDRSRRALCGHLGFKILEEAPRRPSDHPVRGFLAGFRLLG